MTWQAGISRAVITPDTPVLLAGYGGERVPRGVVHDLWVKSLALEDDRHNRGVIITCDHMGIPRSMVDRLRTALRQRCDLDRARVMLLFSHNHCGPVLRGDLVDYYPLDDEQQARIDAYTDQVTASMADSAARALQVLHPVQLSTGTGVTRFAVNRRDNPEVDVAGRLARGEPLAGAVDHSVPVMAIRSPAGDLEGLLFGYACHSTTMAFEQWCGDYPGFAQAALEDGHPGATAMFFPGCGADQNPLPRRDLNLCRRYGHMLAAAVEETLLQPMTPVAGGLSAAFRDVELAFDGVVTPQSLNEALGSDAPVRARWARRWLDRLQREPDAHLPTACPYPVQVWLMGAHVLIALGGEAVVDYALRFRQMYGPLTWVSGYANTLVAYIPSQRVQLEGGYEGNDFLYEYGHGAERWADGVESRICHAVTEMVGALRWADRRRR